MRARVCARRALPHARCFERALRLRSGRHGSAGPPHGAAALGSRRLCGAHALIESGVRGRARAFALATGMHENAVAMYLLWEYTNRTCVGPAITRARARACARYDERHRVRMDGYTCAVAR